VSQFATNGQVGKIIMSFDSDASDGSPTTKQQMEDQFPHCDSMPSENLRLSIPKSMLKGKMNDAHYVRPAGLPGQADIKTYDVGNFFIASQGILNNATVGELHVRYRCHLSIPILGGTILAAPTNNSVAVFTSAVGEAINTGIATVVQMSTANFNGLSAINTAGSIVLPVGNYLIDGNVQLNAATNITIFTLTSNKNAIMIAGNTTVFGAAAVATSLVLPIDPFFYQSNGTDVLTISTTATFAGAGTQGGSLRIVAI